MKLFRNLPIQKKLIFIILAIIVPTLILSGSIFAYNNLKITKDQMVHNLTVLASAIGANTRAALVFQDDTAAQKILSSLKEENQIVSAALYDSNNKVFAIFTPDAVTPFKPPTRLEQGKNIFADHIEIVLPVILKGEEVGKIYLNAHLKEFNDRVKNFMIFAVLTLMSILALALGFTLKLQSIISKPILSLAETAKTISLTSNYSIRVKHEGEDEIGTLVSGFNEMLSQIEKREKALATNQGHLEAKIIECRLAGEEVEKSEASIRTILDNAFDAIITMDAEGVITNWNQRASSIFGWHANEVIGKRLAELIIPTHYRQAHQRGLSRFLSTGKSEIFNQQLELTALNKDGHTFPIELAISATKRGTSYIFTGIIRDITQRKQAQQELIKSRERLRSLNNQLQSVREEEKARIAREIHDELGQALTMLKFDISLVEKEISSTDHAVFQKTKSMKDLIEGTIKVVQRIATELRPQMLDIMGLCETLKWQSKEFQKRTGTICDLIIEPEKIIVDTERSTALFRVYQEALTNVARHAKANRVQTSFKKESNNLILEIKDNGIGMDEKSVGDPQSLGLIGIRERVLIWGGQFQLRSEPGKGTAMTIIIPFSDSDSNDKK
ncbi:MAG: PAS domain S-box protein [Nitrospinales bacterium]